MAKPKYNIIRMEKIKTRDQITASFIHNMRIRIQNNIDPDRSKMNRLLVNTLNSDQNRASSFQENLTEYYKQLGIKERKNNVLMMEGVIQASPEFFQEADKETKEKWVKGQIKFLQEEFGDQLKLVVLHVDEKTPHLHCMIGTEHKSVKKYKNGRGVFEKETWSLNADRYNPDYLRGLHDRHAEANKEFGLCRGEIGLKTEHQDLKDYYKTVKKVKNELENEESPKVAKEIADEIHKSSKLGYVHTEKVTEIVNKRVSSLERKNNRLGEVIKVDYARKAKVIKWKADELKNKESNLKKKEEELKKLEDQLNFKKQRHSEMLAEKFQYERTIEKFKVDMKKMEEAHQEEIKKMDLEIWELRQQIKKNGLKNS